ncbi:hypothetical protein HN51_010077 [Arachis hypogaea]|nr:uncharacterized protein DS421_3g62280 [Arachis hypogaea]
MANSSSNLLQVFLPEKQHLMIMETVEEDLLHGALKPIKIVPEEEEKETEEEEEGFKTPTSEEHRIPAMVECPPAPAKNKNKKRTKHSCYFSRHHHHHRFQSSVIHYSHQDIESLFPALHHLHGGNNKKIKLS